MQGKLLFSTFLTIKEGITDDVSVSDAISRTIPICTEKVLFLNDHKVSLKVLQRCDRCKLDRCCKLKLVLLGKRL